MLEPLDSLFRHIPHDYNEGWNAYWADIARQGGSLYPPGDSPVANNYPPLSFYLIGALGKLCGDNIFAGRMVSLLSLLLVTLNIGLWLRAAGTSAPVAQFTAALFIAAFVVYAPDYVATNDPQLLAHAFMMSGTTILWRYDFSRKAMAAGACLMVLGGLTKHLLIPLPLAVTAWIALYRRDRLATWLWMSALALAAALALVTWLYGTAFFHSLASSRTYSRLLSRRGVIRVWKTLPVVHLLGVGAVAACVSRLVPSAVRRFATLTVLYGLCSLAIGVWASSGAGVDRNAFFDFAIAACLAVGATLEQLRSRPAVFASHGDNTLLVVAMVAAFAASYAVEAFVQLPRELRLVAGEASREAQYKAQIATIAAAGPGGAACETLSLCYWAGEPFAVDFFNYGQKLATNAIRSQTCERVFAEGSFELLELDAPRSQIMSRRLPASCNHLIADRFTAISATPYGTLLRRQHIHPGAEPDEWGLDEVVKDLAQQRQCRQRQQQDGGRCPLT